MVIHLIYDLTLPTQYRNIMEAYRVLVTVFVIFAENITAKLAHNMKYLLPVYIENIKPVKS